MDERYEHNLRAQFKVAIDLLTCGKQPRRACRMLSEIASAEDFDLSGVAHNMVALCYLQQMDYRQSIDHLKTTISEHGESIEAIWAMRLLSSIYRILGLKYERLLIDDRKMVALKRMAFGSSADKVRMFALSELAAEYTAQDFPEHAERVQQEYLSFVQGEEHN